MMEDCMVRNEVEQNKVNRDLLKQQQENIIVCKRLRTIMLIHRMNDETLSIYLNIVFLYLFGLLLIPFLR